MDTDAKRSDRGMKIEIPIEVAGADCLGVHFLDRTRTLAIGRHGGKVVLDRKLVPQQDVTVRCLATGREADARIVGQVAKSGDHHHYGIKFLDQDANIWGMEFPPPAAPEETVGRVLLQCTGCRDQEVMYLDEFEKIWSAQSLNDVAVMPHCGEGRWLQRRSLPQLPLRRLPRPRCRNAAANPGAR